MTWRERVSADPAICHGQVCIRGTRLFVSVVLDNLAAGSSPEQIVTDYPSLSVEGVHACLAYGHQGAGSERRVRSAAEERK